MPHRSYLIDGIQTLSGDPTDLANLIMINDQLDVDGPANTMGVNVLVSSGLNIDGQLNNNGWIVPEDGSELQAQSLTGSGDITAIDSTVVIAGGAPTSETIGLVDNAQLYLGSTYGIPSSDPSPMAFLATVDMDSTSIIHLYTNPTGLVNLLSSNEYHEILSGAGGPANLIQGLAIVNSLTPGYQPEIEVQWAGTGGISAVLGVTIVDKPIIAGQT